MIELKRLKLINWHNFENTTFDCARLTYMIGVNAVGKTTILDAIRYCLTTNRNFNALGNKKSGRTLQGSVHAKQRGENAYRRPGHTVAYIGAEFWDSVKHTSFVIAVRVESEGPMQELHPRRPDMVHLGGRHHAGTAALHRPAHRCAQRQGGLQARRGAAFLYPQPQRSAGQNMPRTGHRARSQPAGQKSSTRCSRWAPAWTRSRISESFCTSIFCPSRSWTWKPCRVTAWSWKTCTPFLPKPRPAPMRWTRSCAMAAKPPKKQTEALVNRGAALLARAAADVGEKGCLAGAGRRRTPPAGNAAHPLRRSQDR